MVYYRMKQELSEGWEVEWCFDLPRDSDGSVDIDSAKYQYADFKTKEAAIIHAKKVLPLDQFGSVRITPFHSEHYEEGCSATFREYDSDAEYVEA